MALPIPNKAVIAVLVGNAQTIPRGTDIAICSPAGATVYTLPKLDVEPASGSYMQGQVLQLRNRTAFTITLTPAAGDTIGGNATLAVTAQQFVMLGYVSGSNWSIVATLTSAADPAPAPEEVTAEVASPTATGAMSPVTSTMGDTATQNANQTATQAAAQLSAQEARAKLPTTPVKTLNKHP